MRESKWYIRKAKACLWGIKIAWRINRTMFLVWMAMSIIIAVIPSVILFCNKQILQVLSDVFLYGQGYFSSLFPWFILLGVFMFLSLFSIRLNDDFLYMVMYDFYYLGMEEVMMDSAQAIALSELYKKEQRDSYFSAVSRCGSLTDFMSSGVSLFIQLASIIFLMLFGASSFPYLFVFTFIYIGIILVINILLSGKIRIEWSQQREFLRKTEYFEQLARDGDTAKETRIFNSAEQIKEYWEEAYKKVEEKVYQQENSYALLEFCSSVGFYLFLFISICYCILKVANSAMSTEQLLIMFMMCTSIASNVNGISKSFQRMDYGLFGLDMQQNVFCNTFGNKNTKEAKYDIPINEDEIFSIKNLTFSYGSGKNIIEDISFNIRKGEVIALVGMNGSGKTTLIKLLLGLLTPTQGEVFFKGRRISEYSEEYVYNCIGSYFQDTYIYHFPISENVGVGDINNVGNISSIMEALDMGGASGIIDKLPNGINTILGRQVLKNGTILSGGESQRIGVSRAHMSKKPIMIFDEPASSLDPIAELTQFQNIRNQLIDKTVILVSHRIAFAKHADKILVLNEGRLIESGKHEELIAKDGIYSMLFNIQAKWYEDKDG